MIVSVSVVSVIVVMDGRWVSVVVVVIVVVSVIVSVIVIVSVSRLKKKFHEHKNKTIMAPTSNFASQSFRNNNNTRK